MKLTFLALLLIMASVGFSACSDDDDLGTEPTQPESTTQAADEPTRRDGSFTDGYGIPKSR